MLRMRLISAAIIVSTIVALIWLDYQCGTPEWLGKSGLMLLLSLFIVAPMAVRELLHFNQVSPHRIEHVRSWSVYVATFLVLGFSFVPLMWQDPLASCSIGALGWPLFGMAAAVGLAFLSQMTDYQAERRYLPAIAFTIFVSAYIGGLLSFWPSVRWHGGNAWGIVGLFSLFLPVKLSDAAAYGFGKMWGKRKLAPNLSPGKTVEGLLGSFVGGILGAAAVFYGIGPLITGETCVHSWLPVVVFGIAVTIAGVMGDLAESMLKRDCQIKNSSRWLPGLGGVLDIIDSVLATGPVVLAMWKTGWFGPHLS